MLQGMLGDDTMSNLTYASNEATLSSSSNINRNQEIHSNINNQASVPAKKKRNLPGNPDPDSEVVALSPKALMATNRFVCEICNKGFQRDQNLQLHRRGHNLPWKLKQRSKTEIVKRKVYVCPEPSCVHHHPSRALGDLTGIKKHFCRKHGEKKWKCEKCSKRYAVLSDWKAHSKLCGTREYRCDCSALFSRRDRFITHRAFCDALAEESSRSIPQEINPIFLSYSQTAPNQIHSFHQQNPLIPLLKQENHNFNIPPWLLSSDTGAAGPGHPINQLLTLPRLEQTIQESPNNNISTNTLGGFSSSSPSLTSATALLQKASQMGVTMSNNHMGAGALGFCATASTSTTAGMPSREDFVNMVGSNNSLPCASGFNVSFAFDNDSFNGMLNPKRNISFHESRDGGGAGGPGGGGEGLTRDFLGLRAFPHRDFLDMAGLDQLGSSAYDHQAQNQTQWHSSN